MSRALRRHTAFALAVAALTAALYVPFLGNPLVFDDKIFFSGHRFAYYATHPLGLDLRLPPYFSLAITQVLSGGIVAQRVVGLLKNDPRMRQVFFNQIAGPVMNKMFECGMIP